MTLEPGSAEMNSDGYSWTVNGKAFNTSGKPLGSISVIFMSLDGNGNVAANSSTSIYPSEGASAIQPGESNDFSITVYAPEGLDLNSQNHQIILQGVVSQ